MTFWLIQGSICRMLRPYRGNIFLGNLLKLTVERCVVMSFNVKVYPRLRLDISFPDLILSYGSVFDRPRHSPSAAQIAAIQSIWLNEFCPTEVKRNELKKFDRAETRPARSIDNVLVTLSVRTAFDLLLQSLALPPGSEVLMSAVTIRHMVEIVECHDLIPIPVDIDLATLAPAIGSLEALISGNSKVLVIAHLFGAIINLDPYIEICRQHNILLVEDCAQAFAGSKYPGHTEADVSFFSFGLIKSCTALGGAVSIIKDTQLATKMHALEQTYPLKREDWFYGRVSKSIWLKLLTLPWIYGLLLILIQALGKDLDATINGTARGFSQGDILTKIRYRPPAALMALLHRRLQGGDRLSQTFATRASIARQFLTLLKPGIICPGNLADFHSFWLVHILTEHPKILMVKLREHGFDATRGTTSLVVVTPSTDRDIPLPTNSAYLLQHCLCLPVSPALPKTELKRLAGLINEFAGC